MNRYAQYLRLNVSVHATNRELIAAIRKKMLPSARKSIELKKLRHQLYRELIEQHKAAQELYLYVYSGELPNEYPE